ncbi:MAG: hypothetical protein BROFUL_01518 [Candidatus Brocadia fulgida]|jgi:hypothetical protein|uniref:Uncharacterized protein n=1 Tax=Candidatus Brocadia fulgida TaxID=380242 RepID=A0A0M2UXU6_9BACT|nr:MAG: hypothetical protein BROFUL_01518 [Candidatus Brocadia fulgida]
MTIMYKSALLTEIKLMELKLQALKTQVKSKKPKVKTHTSATLYGLLKGSQDITSEDIEAVKIKQVVSLVTADRAITGSHLVPVIW